MVREYRRRVISEEVASLRRDYEAEGLVESEMAAEPYSEFERWFRGAAEAGIEQPNAFVLATVDGDGTVSARALLMKDFDRSGLTFFTGLGSTKSRALENHPRAAATFVWLDLHRQVRFQGSVERVADSVADEYFATRPRGAQLAAHSSNQSEVVADRAVLDQRFREYEAEFEGVEVPRPDHWGGWRLVPDVVEFWQGQPDRFHDRVRYRSDSTSWVKERLAP